MQIIDIYPAIIEACDFCDEFSSVSIVEDTFVVCPECLKSMNESKFASMTFPSVLTLSKLYVNYRSSEGKCVKIPYKGLVSETVKSILGGLRSACTYTGARTIKQMPKCATFIRVTQQSNEVFGKNT